MVRTCQSGSLKYHKCQSIESEAEDYITTVSSREVGINRREEGKTKSCQKNTQGQRDEKRTGNDGGRQKLKHVDGDFPWCIKRKGEDNEAKTRENENSRGKGGGREKTSTC